MSSVASCKETKVVFSRYLQPTVRAQSRKTPAPPNLASNASIPFNFQTMFYSLWLRPASPELTSLLEKIIVYESRSKPGSSDPFDPHITLYSLSDAKWADISLEQVVKKTWNAVDAWRRGQGRKEGEPLKLMSIGPITGDHFWQCVMLGIDPEDSLLSLRRQITNEAFPPGPASYFPHMSLVYADFGEDVKKGCADETKQRWGNEVTGEMEFDRIEVWLCTTEKTTKGWRKVGEVTL